jgi:hypothetical protein
MLASTSADPACGKCGYCVRGLQASVCPECGSDLRKVGIRTGRSSRFILPLLRITIWSIILPVAAALVSALLFAYVLPVVRERHLQREFFSYRSPQTDNSLTIVQRGRELAWIERSPDAKVPMTGMTIINSECPDAPLQVNLVTGDYQYIENSDKHVISAKGFNSTALLNWLGACGFNRSDPAVQEEAADAMACINSISDTGPSNVYTGKPGIWATGASPTSEFLASSRPEWVEFGVPVFWIAVWLAGGWKLARYRPSRA